MRETAIEIKNLVINYRNLNRMSIHQSIMNPNAARRADVVQALKGVSFEVEKGEILGIIGRNGSGKSTMLKAIAGIFQPDEGSIDTKGKQVSLMSIGVGFKPEITGRENIMTSGMLLGFSPEYAKSKMEEIIEFSELGEFIDRPVRTYSSGMYSKLTFAITAVLETEIMLVDEVLSVGDEHFRKKSFNKMKDLILDNDRTVIIVSHAMDTLRELCTRILWLHDGEIKMIGETDEVLDAYQQFMSV